MKLKTYQRLLLALLSVVLLSLGWLRTTGLVLLVALVPLLIISASYDSSRRSWWRMAGWVSLVMGLWTIVTCWWIYFAAAVGIVAATVVQILLFGGVFMVYHYASKRTRPVHAYTLLVAGWLWAEHFYLNAEISFPWLVLGNGFANDVWAVQWYEWTGVFGGSLWVLVANLLIFEALNNRSAYRITTAALGVALPMVLSLTLWLGYEEPTDDKVTVSTIQPNIDCYEKFANTDEFQIANIFDLVGQVPAEVDFILLPETAMPGYYWEPTLSDRLNDEESELWQLVRNTLRQQHPEAMLLTGTNTRRYYPAGLESKTARRFGRGQGGYDHFNTAVGIDTTARVQLHHKAKLVIGVENTPTWVFELMDFLVIDLGGIVGQIGKGTRGSAFDHAGVKIGPAICYEGVYGEFFGDHVRRGAELMAILSNDGWWGDTPGYKHLFSLSRLRAIEHRRAVVRSANTGQSGFISPRGDVGSTLGWEERGVLTEEVTLNRAMTFYTRHGDFLARIANYLLLLCVLYYVAYRVKRHNHLVN